MARRTVVGKGKRRYVREPFYFKGGWFYVGATGLSVFAEPRQQGELRIQMRTLLDALRLVGATPRREIGGGG